MNKHYTVMVMDASGSMGRMREEALDACNQQLRDIRKNVEGDDIVARVGLVKFASTVEEPTVWNRPISKVNNLQKRDYKTGGMTAMLDAVGTAIDKLMELEDINDEDTTVLVNIISDGDENNSKEYSYEAIAEKIKKLQETGRWTFTYSGANQDLSKLSQRLSIPTGNMQAWTATSKGLKDATTARSGSFSGYFSEMKRRKRSGDKKFQASNFYSG